MYHDTNDIILHRYLTIKNYHSSGGNLGKMLEFLLFIEQILMDTTLTKFSSFILLLTNLALSLSRMPFGFSFIFDHWSSDLGEWGMDVA